ncbi:zinc-binding dehydrogenase [Dactylosporangium siamense]|uniref:NADPH:quinone reductase n=1 Tax=Dactylosporangium siamense TaxID=685454 RepID=A0A919PNF2_9ACTN|nr:NADPH:quinone reductase [Dactylosporangium siamense]
MLELGEAPEPVPGPDEVLIRVEAAGITFIETQTRAGRAPKAGAVPPAVLGNGVGGTVAGVGAGGDPALIGRTVVASLNGTGGYAELAVAAARNVVLVPDGVSTLDATALLADGRTALGLHELAAPQPGETVLVEAAAGGVGSLLVQLARNAGARVVGAASGERKLQLIRDLGAEAVDYTVPGWTDPVKGFDVVYDGVGGTIGREALAATVAGGRFVVHGAAGGPPTQTGEGVTGFGFPDLMRIGQRAPELAAKALQAAAEGRLRPVIGQTFPLDRAADAHAAIEARGTLGKTLLIV